MTADFKNILVLICILSSGVLFAQRDTTDQGDLDTEKLIIIKPYSPTVNDAVKVKQTPKNESDSTITQKKKIDYEINSFPVASTFTPDKGQATGVGRKAQPDLYNNYAALGVGNYTNVLAQFFSNIELNNGNDLTLGFDHNSSQGGIKDLVFKDEDKYYNTKFDIGYNAEAEKFYWGARAGVLHQQYSWYGVFDDDIEREDVEDIDPKHTYMGLSLGGDLKMKEGVLDKVSLDFNHFSDNFKGSENRMLLNPNLKFELGENNHLINTKITADYLSGNFKPKELDHYDYSWLNVDIHPSMDFNWNDLSLNIGFDLAFANDLENSENEIYIYPKLKGSYQIAGDYFSLYGGIDGGLDQNTYYDLAQENPYLRPALAIVPTHRQFDFYLGAKGKFTDELKYNFRANYTSEEDKPLYSSYYEFAPGDEPYMQNNSFAILYDKIKTFSVFGSLAYDFTDDLNIGISATYHTYSTEVQNKAWNLPNFEGGLVSDYQISEKWVAGLDILYKGDRYDFTLNPSDYSTIDSYFDANLRLDFQLDEQLGFFGHVNNLFAKEYDRWNGYPVQGIQFMVGATYRF